MISFDDLKHNSIVLTGFEFVESNPLGFFEFNDNSDIDKCFSKKQESNEALGKLVFHNYGFKSITDENGKQIASKDKFIVSRAKSRPVLIFQDMDLNKSLHKNCFIIPIQTIKKPDRENFSNINDYSRALDKYNLIINRDERVYNYYYIPKQMDSGKIYERALILHDARFVHKSTLFGQVKENQLNEEELKEIGMRLGRILNIQKLEQCSECQYNYENYTNNSEEVINDTNVINFSGLKK